MIRKSVVISLVYIFINADVQAAPPGKNSKSVQHICQFFLHIGKYDGGYIMSLYTTSCFGSAADIGCILYWMKEITVHNILYLETSTCTTFYITLCHLHYSTVGLVLLHR